MLAAVTARVIKEKRKEIDLTATCQNSRRMREDADGYLSRSPPSEQTRRVVMSGRPLSAVSAGGYKNGGGQQEKHRLSAGALQSGPSGFAPQKPIQLTNNSISVTAMVWPGTEGDFLILIL